MNFREYKSLAMRTKNNNLSVNETIINACYGLTGELGEVVDLYKKVIFHNHELTDELTNELKKEIGDVCWYLALIADTFNYDCNLLEVDYLNKLSNQECINAMIKAGSKLNIELLRATPKSELIIKILKQLIIDLEYLCYVNDFDFKQILKLNIEKLMKRYPSGFSSTDSINRTN